MLYTNQKTKKAKTWHDGSLKFSGSGTKVGIAQNDDWWNGKWTNMFYKYIIDKSIGFVEILTEVIDCIMN